MTNENILKQYKLNKLLEIFKKKNQYQWKWEKSTN